MIKLKNSFLQILSLCFLIILLGFSCKSDKKEKNGGVVINSDFDIDNTDKEEIKSENFKIPSPMEVFTFMEKSGSGFIKEVLNDPENYRNYNSQKSKAVNFGIYSADLAYCCIYEDFQGTIDYFDVVKKLASDLGLNEGFGKQMVTRIDNNLSNIDSLQEIASDSYYEATIFLEEQGLSDLLGFILAGGWMETLYLATESVKQLPLSDPVYERIADQRFLLENLKAYLKTQGNSQGVDELLVNLNELSKVYEDLYFNDENTIITQNQFVNIANKVKELRNLYIR
ncbi:MAG: hypothetical protein JEZ09_09770 [Salinivirgaceae bacterium]|nr:hypothetical protein [Salinivirgaceae bacterium]